MGDKIRTIQNLEIIKSDLENNLIFIKGSIPGSKNSLVLIQKSEKEIKRSTTLEKLSKIKTEIIKTSEKKESSKSKKDVDKPKAKQTDNISKEKKIEKK